MKTISNIETETMTKPSYESVTCQVTVVEMQGVLCASNSSSGSLTGGLDSYRGSAL